MKKQIFFYRGTEINKLQFSEIEDYIEEKGLDVNEIFARISDENEMVYVSSGFLRGLLSKENEEGEWHHFFKKDKDGNFIAGKMKFK